MEAWEIKSHGKEGDNFRRISGKGNIEILKEVMAEMVPKLMKLKRFRKFI